MELRPNIKGYQLKKNYRKLLLRIFEVLQIALGENLTCSFRDIFQFSKNVFGHSAQKTSSSINVTYT